MARETLPGAGADERDDATDVTRERLDGAPVTGWRAPVAAWAERLGVWLGASTAPSAAPAVARPAVPTWERRLNIRQKLARGALATLAVALALFVLLGGLTTTRSALDTLNARLFPPAPTPTITSGDYTLQKLPPSAQHMPLISLAPAVARPGVAFACWTVPFRGMTANQRGVAAVYQTTDFARTWRRLSVPTLVAVDCAVVTDATGGVGALAVVNPGYTPDGYCHAPALLHSADGGATWRVIPWANPGAQAPCDISLALDGDAIYAWSTQPLLAGALPARATGRLIVTRDAGATWTVADAGLSDDTGLALVGFRAGGRILATTPDVSGPPGASALMESRDYGATWRSLGDPPGAFAVVYASTDPSATGAGGWGRLYEIAEPLIGGAPAGVYTVFLATATAGSRWTPLPLPPLAARDHAGFNVVLPQVLGVGPAGSLLVERGVVQGIPDAQLAASRRLWVWSAGQGRWLLDPQPTLGDADLFGWGWSHGDQTVWVSSIQLGVPPTLRLFTRTLTAANLGPAH